MWDQKFETLLRDRLPGLDAGAPLTEDLPLAAFGLDSMATVGLIVAIEESYGTQLPDDAVQPAHFTTPGTVWKLVSSLAPSTPGTGR
ncbi:phosphopantetheine-binding protein [Streptomyces sp. NPDC012466]|jgi:acyl carrier protein|uniref:acyl carrier protein n=1 Tax=Streptomyces sp. NPDC012466 TaxID=3364835 RepID=UPI0036EC03D3